MLHGSLEDLESLKKGAATTDGVIHCAFNHDFSKFAENCETDRRAIEALGEVMVGSNRPLVITSGVGIAQPGKLRIETDEPNPSSENWPRKSEEAAAIIEAKGVKVMTMRLPQVHDQFKQGLVTYTIAIARQKGVSAYIGEGLSRWAAVHVLDAALLYRLVLEKGEKGLRYNAVAEEGVTAKEIAEAIGRGLKLPVKSISPEEAFDHFGFLSMFAKFDLAASSALTQKRLDSAPQRTQLNFRSR